MANELEQRARHIEVLRDWKANIGGEGTADEHAALDAAIAALQQAQQPGAQAVAIVGDDLYPRWVDDAPDLPPGTKLYTAPPPLPEGVSEEAKALAYYRPCFERTAPTYVPSRVRLNYPVCGDPPIGHTTEAPAGDYDCECNRYGAVSVRATNGKMLGIKPAEFEVLEWRENDRARLAAKGGV